MPYRLKYNLRDGSEMVAGKFTCLVIFKFNKSAVSKVSGMRMLLLRNLSGTH